jgi:hypothetical protein
MQSAVEFKPCVIQVFPSKKMFLIFTFFFISYSHFLYLPFQHSKMYVFYSLFYSWKKHSFISTVKTVNGHHAIFMILFFFKLKTCGLIWILWTEWMRNFSYIYFLCLCWTVCRIFNIKNRGMRMRYKIGWSRAVIIDQKYNLPSELSTQHEILIQKIWHNELDEWLWFYYEVIYLTNRDFSPT